MRPLLRFLSDADCLESKRTDRLALEEVDLLEVGMSQCFGRSMSMEAARSGASKGITEVEWCRDVAALYRKHVSMSRIEERYTLTLGSYEYKSKSSSPSNTRLLSAGVGARGNALAEALLASTGFSSPTPEEVLLSGTGSGTALIENLGLPATAAVGFVFGEERVRSKDANRRSRSRFSS